MKGYWENKNWNNKMLEKRNINTNGFSLIPFDSIAPHPNPLPNGERGG